MALETSADSPAPLRQISSLLNGYIGRLGAVWVEAEVAQLQRRPGMCFITLRDLQATVSIQAKCYVRVLDSSPMPIIEGSRVVVHAKPDFYEPKGSLALEIREIRPQGEGELLAQLERRKQLLAAEGLFDIQLKKATPALPRGIGLITGRDSAAERDVIENATLRWPGVRIVVQHALMQGPHSASAVIDAVAGFDADPSIDVIIVARGGGSMEDLLPFSDEGLVRAVYACHTPVVSAIGHEPDVPLLDLVADVRASTPTDAAKTIVPDVAEEQLGLTQTRQRARAAVESIIEREQHGLDSLRSRPVLANPANRVESEQLRVDEHRIRLRRVFATALDRAHDDIGHHLARVRALSPKATLERGYAIAQLPDGTVAQQRAQVGAGTSFRLQLADGGVTATSHGDAADDAAADAAKNAAKNAANRTRNLSAADEENTGA